MKKFLLLLILLSGTNILFAKSPVNNPLPSQSRDSITKGKYTLIFINEYPAFDPKVKENLIHTFFKVYPKEAKEYNPSTLKKVTILIDTSYKGVAATGNGVVHINPQWFYKHPKDIDVVTHEVMHIVQDYHKGHHPGWLTEGIADYARYEFGVANKAADWSLTPFNSKQSYKNAYRITARFLVWIRQNVDKHIVKQLDGQLRKGSYTSDSWKQFTGKTVDELWKMYAANPAVKVHYR